MKKIIISWNISQNGEYKTVYICEDDFVEITRAKLLDKAHCDGMPMPPDSLVVEDFKIGIIPNKH